MKESISAEDYVKSPIGKRRRSCFASLRMGVYPLKIETDRWRGKPLSDRLCDQCDARQVECEHHFLLKCAHFASQRQRLVNCIKAKFPDFDTWDEVDKVCYMLSDGYYEVSKYIVECAEHRL